jgi:4-hydroxybenzoate polyprenyltransferase
MSTRLRAMVDACHPGPSATVTIVITALAAAAGRDGVGLALMAAASLTGQLSVGWCNDANDADRDRDAARTEKPTVRGDVTAGFLWRAAFVALGASVVLSFLAAGWIGGGAHVIAVLSAWTYNLVLKTTVFSAVPYAVSFGLVPVFVTYGLTPSAAPPAWLIGACALLGVSAHLANAIPDVDSDELVGAGGVVAAVGVRAAAVAALVSLVVAVGLLAANLDLAPAVAVGVVLVAALGAVVVAVRGQGRGRGLFRYVMVLAVVAVVLVLVSARSLSS